MFVAFEISSPLAHKAVQPGPGSGHAAEAEKAGKNWNKGIPKDTKGIES